MGGFVGALVLAAALVTGQAGGDVDDAKTYFRAGQQAYKAGFYLDAARAFEQAYEIVPNPAIMFSLGQTYRRQFLLDGAPVHLRRAISSYRKYLQAVPRGGRSNDAIEHLGELEARRLAQGLPPVDADGGEAASTTKTQLMVSSQTPAATARVDGADAATVPLVLEVKPGPHEIVLEAEGHFPQTLRAVAIEGRLVVSQADLRERPARLAVKGTDGAQVSVDGRVVGKLPFSSALALPAGRHFVAVSSTGHRTKVEEVEVGRGEEVELDGDLSTTLQRKTSYWFIGAGGALFVASAAMVGVALVSEGQARLILRERDVQMRNLTADELDRYISARDRRNDLLTVSSGTIVGALVIGGIGTALWLLDDPEPVLAPGGLSPMIGPDGAGIGWSGTF